MCQDTRERKKKSLRPDYEKTRMKKRNKTPKKANAKSQFREEKSRFSVAVQRDNIVVKKMQSNRVENRVKTAI